MAQITEYDAQKLEEEKKALKAALDGLIELLKIRNAQGRPNPEVQELVEKALTALMFGDVTVAENWLNLAAEQLGLEEENEDSSAEGESDQDNSQHLVEEIPPPEEIEDLIAYFAEKIEDCVKKGINAEKTLDILMQAQESYEKGDLETAWRAARTGIKAFELEMACLEEEKK